jgi:phosphatidylserine synthase
MGQARGWGAISARAAQAATFGAMPALFLLRSTRQEVYNILWALVFGFATINILSLGARRFEQEKGGLNFGEMLAILVVVVSIVLLGWELLYQFGILPIRLNPS